MAYKNTHHVGSVPFMVGRDIDEDMYIAYDTAIRSAMPCGIRTATFPYAS